MNVIDTLVTDRAFDDVRFLTEKGIYRDVDMNRVEAAVQYLAQRLKNMGYQAEISEIVKNHAVPIFDTDENGTPVLDEYGDLLIIGFKRWSDTTWIEEDIPNFDQVTLYLKNLEAVRSAVPVFPSTPKVPSDLDMFTYREANDIEQILVDVDHIMNNIEAAWMYSGEVYAGEIV